MKVVEVSKTVTEKIYFEKCSLHKHLGQARNKECLNDCWVQVTGKPGRKTSNWEGQLAGLNLTEQKE